MRFDQRSTLSFIVGAALACASGSIMAQAYPSRPITVIVANSAGNPTDTAARVVTPELAKLLGQPVLVENRPGAGSQIGYEYVAKRVAPDGYTIAILLMNDLATVKLTTKDLPFDPITDLPPIAGLAGQRQILAISSTLPWKSVADLQAAARANPGKYNIGYAGPLLQLLANWFVSELQLKIQDVPYNNAGALGQDLLAGRVEMAFQGASSGINSGGKMRILAVTGDQRRAPIMDVPTFAELGHPRIPGINFSMNAPAATPKAVVDRLAAAANRALTTPEVMERYAKIPMDIVNEGPEAAQKRLLEASNFFSEIARKAGIQPQ